VANYIVKSLLAINLSTELSMHHKLQINIVILLFNNKH